jgi:hypothetical protein
VVRFNNKECEVCKINEIKISAREGFKTHTFTNGRDYAAVW